MSKVKKMISNNYAEKNSPNFQAKFKFTNMKDYTIKSINHDFVMSSDVFSPKIGVADAIHSEGSGPCVTICINSDKAKMVHIRPASITEKSKEMISSIIKTMCNGDVKNCLIIGGDRNSTPTFYNEILNIAQNIDKLKNKITAFCGHKDMGFSSSIHYNSKNDTFLINNQEVKNYQFKKNIVNSNNELDDFYETKIIAPNSEIIFDN